MKEKNEELLAKCKPLSDYMTLINKINCYKKTKSSLKEAVDQAINECIEENVLADFLRKHRGDVMNSCLTEFSEELFKKGVFEEGRNEANIENARNLFLNGAPFDLVRKSIKNISDEKLQEIYDEVIASKNQT